MIPLLQSHNGRVIIALKNSFIKSKNNFIKSKNTLLKVTPSYWESYSEYFHGSAD